MKFKILALDVDGVLNTGPHDGAGLQEDKVWLLGEIHARTGCRVLITSTWRKYPHQLARLLKMLKGLCIPVVGVTPVLEELRPSGLFTSKTRTDEIMTWLKEHHDTVGSLCVLDDEPIARPLTYHQIKTETDEGLTPIRAQAVCEMLGCAKFDKSVLKLSTNETKNIDDEL